MKKAILSIFVIQLTVFTFIATAVFFQNRFISMFYQDISYVNVLASDQQAFDAFLSWTKERGIIASGITISPDNEIILHVSHWALEGKLDVLEGRLPEQGEFVSDIPTEDPAQSGLLKRILPDYSFKIYGLHQPKHLGFSSLYAMTTTSEDEIMEMINALGPKGVTIELSDIWIGKNPLLLLSSFSRAEGMLILIFLFSTALATFLSFMQFALQKLKSMSILLSLGYGRFRIVHAVLADLFGGKMWIGSAGILFILFSILILTSHVYRAFYMPIAGIYLAVMGFLVCMYSLLSCCITLFCLAARRRNLSLSIKGRKPHIIVQIAACCVKLASALLFFMALPFLIGLHQRSMVEDRNLQNWVAAKDIYLLSIKDVGQDMGLEIEVELQNKILALYQRLAAENNGFFMDAMDVYVLEVQGADYPLNGLLADGCSTHITVSPNYFRFNPIVTSEGVPVEQELIYADNVLNLLVPESWSSIHDALDERFLDYFMFYRFEIYDRIYSAAPNDPWNPSRQEELEINMIPVRTGQSYFTFSPDIRRDAGNRIPDPVVVVDTGNLHPTSTFTRASRCLYFQYSDGQDMDITDYLAEIVGMDGFVFASSVWEGVAARVLRLKRDYIASVSLTMSIVLGYLASSFSLFANYFARNQYLITVKTLWGFRGFRRYRSASVMLFMPTLLALPLFGLIMATRLSRLFPPLSIQTLLLAGAILAGIDILYFVFMEKLLRKKSMHSILKGESS